MTRRRKIGLALLALFTAAVVLVATVPAVRAIVLPWREEVWQRFFHRGRVLDKRFYRDDGGTPVAFPSDGITLRAGLYGAAPGERRPGVVLLPGSSVLGRKIAFARVLARALAERGYVVLAVDLAGFGDSDDPADLSDGARLDGIADALAAVAFLASMEEADPARLAIAGHSMGASIALHAAAREPRVKAVAAIGPGRGVSEKIQHEERYVERFSADRGLSRRVSWDVLRPILLRHDVSAATPLYARPGHVPLLLVDGGLERAEERAALRAAFDAMSEPKRYVTLEGADHYANAAGLTDDNALGFADARVTRELVDAIDATFRDGFEGGR